MNELKQLKKQVSFWSNKNEGTQACRNICNHISNTPNDQKLGAEIREVFTQIKSILDEQDLQ